MTVMFDGGREKFVRKVVTRAEEKCNNNNKLRMLSSMIGKKGKMGNICVREKVGVALAEKLI